MTQLSSSPLDRIFELKDEAEKQKVELTPEVKAYIQANLDIVQGKLAKGEAVTEDDMKFVDEVRATVGFMIEAQKRHITSQQWLDLLHVAVAAGKPKEWIDEQFQFPGKGKIKVPFLDFSECAALTHLPENLESKRDLYFPDCIFLTHLPEHLKVGGLLELRNCISLAYLPENLKVGEGLYLEGCKLISYLPENLEVGENLFLLDCISLPHLPKNLMILGDIYLSGNLQTKVKSDAERLKLEGKIKGGIKYVN